MMSATSEKKRRRDLAHTVSVLVSSALVQHELQQEFSRKEDIKRTFEFEALAAASGPHQLMAGEVLVAQGGQMSVRLSERNGELWLLLQATGYASMSDCAGLVARLMSRNGAIDYLTRFNKKGSATCVLDDTQIVREGLCYFKVSLLMD